MTRLHKIAPWPVNFIDPAPAIARRIVHLLHSVAAVPGKGTARKGLHGTNKHLIVNNIYFSMPRPSAEGLRVWAVFLLVLRTARQIVIHTLKALSRTRNTTL